MSLRNAMRCALLAGLLACAFAFAASAEEPPAPTREQVREAVARVSADPLLGRVEIQKRLRMKERDEEEAKLPEVGKEGDKWRWLVALGAWISETMRALVWVLGAIVVALVLVRLGRWIRARDVAGFAARAALPSHVQNLDIRPESLPDVIGAAAAALWQRGEQRAALSLLYRGALSRLVHVYALPIRAASTEGECLALADGHLDAPRVTFFAQLVGVWQRAVYGAHMPEATQALNLCREFDVRLAPAPAAPAEGAA